MTDAKGCLWGPLEQGLPTWSPVLGEFRGFEKGCLNMESFTQMGIFEIGSEAFNFGGQLISLGAMKMIYTLRQKFRDQKTASSSCEKEAAALHKKRVYASCISTILFVILFLHLWAVYKSKKVIAREIGNW